MAELADAADSKSAGTWYLGGSIPPPGTSVSLLFFNAVKCAQEELMPDPKDRQAIAAQNVTEARNLLHSLRQELEEHPKLEEAIVKLELALENLTLNTGGML